MLKYTYKSGGNSLQKMLFYFIYFYVGHFPFRPWLTMNCDGIKDQFIRKDWNDTWVTACHAPYGKKSIKPL